MSTSTTWTDNVLNSLQSALDALQAQPINERFDFDKIMQCQKLIDSIQPVFIAQTSGKGWVYQVPDHDLARRSEAKAADAQELLREIKQDTDNRPDIGCYDPYYD